MLFKKSNTVTALLAALGTFSMGVGAAYANNTATITIANTRTTLATYSASLATCAAAVTPAFVNRAAGTSGVHSALAAVARTFSCGIYYSGSTDCKFVVSRLTTQTINPVTGVATYTWNYPQVVVTGGAARCAFAFTSVSDTNTVVTGTNGNFSVTLTMQ